MKFILTNRGLMRCTVPEFKAQEYKGLKQNCGRKSQHDVKKQEPTTKKH